MDDAALCAKLNKKHIVVSGHYGTGKTNIAVALALALAGAGHKVAIVDIDMVNPYFRAADAAGVLERAGVRVIAPRFANTNLDLPVLPEMGAVFSRVFDRVVFDVGGDGDGATVLGTCAGRLIEQGCDMLGVISMYRPSTATPQAAAEMLAEIERNSKLSFTGLINNSNLGGQTTAAHVSASAQYAAQTAALAGLPLICTTVMDFAGAADGEDVYRIPQSTKSYF